MSTFVYNGVQLEANFTDADFVEKFEQANNTVLQKVNSNRAGNGKSNAQIMREQCTVINEMFDAVFGDGTAAMLFGGKNDIMEHFEAFGALVDMADEPARKVSDITNKYLQKNNSKNYQQKPHKQYQYVGGKTK